MFHLFKYRIKALIGNKKLLFWLLLFPLSLATLFKLTLGDGTDVSDQFSTIPVAIVLNEEEGSDTFLSIIEDVQNGEKPLFSIQIATGEDAKSLLDQETIKGIITYGSSIELTVGASGLEESIIKSFVEQYKRSQAILTDIAIHHPEKLETAMEMLTDSNSYLNSVSLGGESISCNYQYYYALIAMTCIYGTFLGNKNSSDILANLSPLAARRCITPTHKMKLILSDLAAALVIHFAEIVLVVGYIRFVLGVNIAVKAPLFFLACFFGSLIGICIGQFIGSISKGSEALKTSISVGISMLLSFLSGLMVAEIKDAIQQKAPILNSINPNALITDMFYSLTVYDDYSRYIKSLISLIILAAILLIGNFLVIRRERYASV